jgi:hypothetical protein
VTDAKPAKGMKRLIVEALTEPWYVRPGPAVKQEAMVRNYHAGRP